MEKNSVTFFMLYYKRPGVTRMSLWHMAGVIKKFEKAGHKCHGIAIGDEPDQAEYCESLGIEHLNCDNDPLPDKFKFAWMSALAKETDYICWLGSNNVHSDEYWDACIKQLSMDPVVSFGSTRFTVVDINKEVQTTIAWKRKSYHLCSCGQFYNTNAINKTIDFEEVFRSERNLEESKDFDGSINNHLAVRWTPRVIVPLESNGLSCIDLKTGTDIHPFRRYIWGDYGQEYTRDEIFEKFNELQMLEAGYFN